MVRQGNVMTLDEIEEDYYQTCKKDPSFRPFQEWYVNLTSEERICLETSKEWGVRRDAEVRGYLRALAGRQTYEKTDI